MRLYLTNTANTRVFKVALPGARMKLVGGDSGRVEHEELIDEVILAPSERVVLDVLFDRANGELTLEHRTPERVYPLAAIRVSETGRAALEARFEVLRTNADMAAERERIASHPEREPDKALVLPRRWTWRRRRGTRRSTTLARCTPRWSARAPGHCLDCGMKLLPAALVAEAGGEHDRTTTYEPPPHHGHGTTTHADGRTASSGKTTWWRSTG